MTELVGGRFEIEREAGAGAMARVFRARDVTTGGLVALKILNGVGDHVMRRFAREAGALAELKHQGIVQYIAHGQAASGHPFLAMEWLDGESLEDRLARGTLSIPDALAIAHGIAAALGAAHARGIVHRDVKPANIFLVGGEPAQPKLLDFGLVRDLDATFALTNTGDLLGTPLYMAPEQAKCDLELDPRVDVYSLGAVLYRCLVGRPPLVANNVVGLLAKIVLEEPTRPSTIAPELPTAVDDLVMLLLAKDRNVRPATGHVAEVMLAAAVASGVAVRAQVRTFPAREQRVVSILLATAHRIEGASLDATFGSFGGALDLADGSTMVVFDGPETPGDLATRAARHALALRAPGAAVALATGRAVLSGPTPMGEVIDAAAGQLAYAHDCVRIDNETAGLIEGRFELASDEHGTMLLGERAGALDSVRTLLGKPTRCIGRDRELAAIEGHFAEVVGESVARAVIVIAEAGVGKSRLAHELQLRLAARAEPPEILVARCESNSARSPFAGAAAVLRRAAGIEPAHVASERTQRLVALLERDAAADPEVVEFLAEIVGIPDHAPSERVLAARENPTLMFDRMRAAWTAWLAHACKRGPVLLVIEDLHWADESTVLLIDAALAALAEAPFMVLGLARPDIRERKPWGARRPHELRLDPLPRRSSERLVREALGPGANDSMIADIVARAEGNALFLEELVRAAARGDIGAVPLGVIGTVQRRLDVLRPDARAALRAASIFGEQFTAARVSALVPADPTMPATLGQLVAEELIALHEGVFAFRHGLVREAAYAMLAHEDRTLGHALAAQILERETTHDAAVIARHFELGHRFADAARWYAQAAERALGHNDLTGALAHAERASAWIEDSSELGALDLIVAEAELWRGRLEEARAAALRAVVRLPDASTAWFEAVGLIITAAGQLGANELVEHWLARAMEQEPEAHAVSAFVLCLSRGSSQLAWGDERTELAKRALVRAEAIAHAGIGPGAKARLEFARAYDFLSEGRIDAGIATLHRVSATYTRLGSARDALQMSMLAHMLSMFAGQLETAYPVLVQYIADAERIEARYLADWTRWEVAIALLIMGERERAAAELARVPAAFVDQPLFHDVAILFRAWAAYLCSDIDELERVVTASTGTLTYTRFRAALDAFGAYVRVRRGDFDAACAQARAAIAVLVNAPGMRTDGCLSAFAPALETLVHAGAPDAAEAVAAHVVRIETIAACMTEPQAGDAFRLRVPWNARILELQKRV